MTEPLSHQEAHQLIRELRIRQSELEEKNQKLQRELEALKAQGPNGPSIAASALVEEDCRKQMSSCREVLRSVIDNIGDLIYIKDLDGVYRGCNEASEKFIGLRESEQFGKTDFDFFDRDRAEEIRETDRQVTMSGKEHCVEEWVSTAGGKMVLLESKKRPLYSAEGEIVGVVGISRDITSRKRAEEKIRELQKDLVSTFAISPAIICVANIRSGFFTRCNPAVRDILGLSEEEFMSKPFLEFVHPDDRERTIEALSKQHAGKAIENFQNRYQCKNGTYKWLSWGGTNPDRDGNLHVVATDINEHKTTENKLRESEKRFRLLVENAPDAIITRNKKGCFTYLNKAAVALFGAASAQELLGTPTIERYHPNTRETLLTRMKIINEQQHAVPLLQTTCLQLNGNEVHVETTAVPINYMSEDGALVFMRDITDRVEEQKRHQQLEEQLHQAQKMESLGRLAGGVAHDFNNMLSVILGNVELAKMNSEQSPSVEESLDQILQAANRSKNITRQLLAFARKQVVHPKVIDLNAALEGMLKMLRNLLGENIDLCWHPKVNLWPVKIDPSQLDQVLANLCINARDAITDVGKMTIETDRVSFDEDYCRDHQGFIPGDFTMLAVSDNGCGMDKEALENIFEPFFTTKNSGEGTGLGMATVYGIVKQSGGFINVYSEPGLGTTFKVYLPRCEEKGETEKGETVNDVQMGQGETVMLVEDELAIMKLTHTILEDLGYRVLAANSPEEAIALAEEHPDEIQLLLTDVVMPEMNGRDLAKKLKAMNPDMDIFYMSGYTANVIAHHGVLDEGINFIEKPFSRKTLSIRLREILDAGF